MIDPELCLRDPNNRCDGAFDTAPAPLLPEPHDAMLLVMWLAENSCGQFDLRSTSGFTNFGGGIVHVGQRHPHRLDGPEPASRTPPTRSSRPWAPPPTIDLSAQTSGLTTVFAATAGSIDDVRYALSQLTYKAPADDATCNLNIAFSDLGNNGMPTSWDPTPVHEIPNAKADKISVTFNVKDTKPEVAVDSALPVGETAGPNKPAAFTVTFSEDVTGFDDETVDLDFSASNAGTVTATILPLTASVYTVTAEGTDDGDIKLSIPAAAATAADPPNDTTEASTAPATIEWDQTGPAPSIAVKAGQANPTGDTTVTFEVDAGETFSSAPASFTGADIDLIGRHRDHGLADGHLAGRRQPEQVRRRRSRCRPRAMSWPRSRPTPTWTPRSTGTPSPARQP